MAVHEERNGAIAIIKMFDYLERELRVGLDDRHLANLCHVISDDLTRRYVAPREKTIRLVHK